MSKDFAIIATGGKQYKVAAGDKVKVEKLGAGAGAEFKFGEVLLRSEGGKVQVGAPFISGAAVVAKVEGDGRSKKKIVFKYHSKTRYRKKKGHRQEYSEVTIAKI